MLLSSLEYNDIKSFSSVSLIFCPYFSISNRIFTTFSPNSLFFGFCCFRVRISLSGDVILTGAFNLGGSKLAALFFYSRTLNYLSFFGMADKLQ